jgi:hypothetical protein
VLLITPDGKTSVVDKWRPKDFSKTYKEGDSYGKFRERTCNISKYVIVSGEYKVEFKYTAGENGLMILRVEL